MNCLTLPTQTEKGKNNDNRTTNSIDPFLFQPPTSTLSLLLASKRLPCLACAVPYAIH